MNLLASVHIITEVLVVTHLDIWAYTFDTSHVSIAFLLHPSKVYRGEPNRV